LGFILATVYKSKRYLNRNTDIGGDREVGREEE
jgi:hypothetical protein